MPVLNQDQQLYMQALGAATINLWSRMPQPMQQKIFERAVRFGDDTESPENLRTQLAKFLHDNHERTKSARAARHGGGVRLS